MTKLLRPFGLSLAFALVVACSSSDPGITGSRGSRGTGSVGGSGNNGGNNGGNNNNGGNPTPSPPPPDFDAGPTPGGADYDAGTPPARDSGGGGTSVDSGTNNAPLGSCGNPRCGGFGNGGDCGCIARDSNGDQIQLGCNGAQGICACFTNGTQSTDVIDAPNACDTNTDTASIFLANCGCQ